MPTKQSRPEQEKTLEATLWEAADRLRSRVDAAEYKHVVLGLIFLKYVSDVFARRREALERLVEDPESDYFMPTDEPKRRCWRTETSTPRRACSGCPRGTAGTTSVRPPSRPTSASESTLRWTRLRRRTRACGECCQRGTHGAN